jgi:hypothetical protein
MLIFLFFSMLAYAQEAPEEEEIIEYKVEYHSLGDQVFGISTGMMFPLFFENPNLPYSDSDRFTDTNLNLGGMGSLYYGAYLDNNWQLGMEVGAMFSASPNKNNFYTIPIPIRGSYDIQLMNNLFTIPVFLGAVISMTSYQNSFNVEMIMNPGAGFYWHHSSSWSFGTKVSYWWIPQLYPGDTGNNRFGNFLEWSLSAVYNF